MGSMRKSRLSPYKIASRSILFRDRQRELRTAFAVQTARQQTFIFSGCAKLSPMNWKLKAKLCSAEKLKLMKATVVADGKENVGAMQCN